MGLLVGAGKVGTGVGPRVVGAFDGALVGAKGQKVNATPVFDSALGQARQSVEDLAPMWGL